VGLQALENKVLSWGTIHKSACVLAESTVRKSQSFTDSLLLALAKQQDFLLLTKDRRLQTIAKELQVGYFDPKFAPGLQ
jgi:predicted nucleic acid-binding protein